MSGNPFYDPLRPGPDWYRGIMALYANLAGAKEKKKAGEQEAEDREWQKLLGEAQLEQTRAQTARLKEPTPVKPEAEIYTVTPGALGKAAEYFGYDQEEVVSWSPTAKKDLITTYQDAIKATKVGAAKGPTAEKPSDYDKKVSEAKALHSAGKITDQELFRVTTGYSGEMTEKDKILKRNKVSYDTRKAVDNATYNNPKIATDKKQIESLKHTLGVDLSMPIAYNTAAEMVKSDLADEKDYETIKKYDEMKQFFLDHLLGKIKKEDFKKTQVAKDPSIDLNTILRWYDIYR